MCADTQHGSFIHPGSPHAGVTHHESQIPVPLGAVAVAYRELSLCGNPEIDLDAGTLSIDCHSEDCTVWVTQVGSRLHIFNAIDATDPNSNPRLGKSDQGLRYFACAFSDVEEIYFSGSSHRDLFGNQTGIPVTARGGDGGDWIVGGYSDDDLEGGDGGDRVEGGPGNDTIDGGSGNDTLFGGDGDDELRGQHGSDEIRGHGGDDELWGGRGRQSLWWPRH